MGRWLKEVVGLPVSAETVLVHMDAGGMPWDPEEPELPQRIELLPAGADQVDVFSQVAGELVHERLLVIRLDRPISLRLARAMVAAYNREREAEGVKDRPEFLREVGQAEPAPEWPEELPWKPEYARPMIGREPWMWFLPSTLMLEVDRRWRECARAEGLVAAYAVAKEAADFEARLVAGKA